jgi:hypothetical protein
VNDQGMPAVSEDRPAGRVILGALLVTAGAALLFERLGTMPPVWRDRIWPLLLIGYGLARLLQPRSQGRAGLFFVLSGAWWLAGVSGLVSIEATWPLLFVALGVSMMFQAVTPAVYSPDSSSRLNGRERGAAPWILLAILIGAAVSSGFGRHTYARSGSEGGVLHVFSVVGRSTSHVGGASTLTGGEVVTIVGGSTIDLRDLTIAPGETVTLDVFTLMGGSAISVPDDWIVDVQAMPVLGGIRDRRIPRDSSREGAGEPGAAVPAGPAPRLVVRGTVIMGGLTIRS